MSVFGRRVGVRVVRAGTVVTATVAALAVGAAGPAQATPAPASPLLPAVIAPPAAGGWQYNGVATQKGDVTVLTTAARLVEGSVVYPVPVSAVGLQVTFTSTIGGGSGADGLAFGLLDAATNVPTSIGDAGGGFAFQGRNAYIVALDTWDNPPQDPSNNFVGISRTSPAEEMVAPTWISSTQVPTPLRGTHTVAISVTATSITAVVDGTTTVTAPVRMFPTAYVAFGAGTGGATDRHAVSAVTITRPAPTGTIGNAVAPDSCLTRAGVNAPTTVTLKACAGGRAQTWRADPTGALVLGDQCLGAASGAVSTPVVLAPCTGAAAQVWQALATGQLRNAATRLCLDGRARPSAVVVPVVLFGCNQARPAQQWSLPTAA